MNAGASTGRIPANVLLSERAIVTAGLAKDVDEVNQYAAEINAATDNATAITLWRRETAMITPTRPKLAMNSPNHCSGPERTFVDAKNVGNPNIKFAAATPVNAPAICVAT